MLRRFRVAPVLLLTLATLTLAACRGAEPPPPTPSPVPTPTALAPTPTVEAGSFFELDEPSGELAFRHVEALAVDIGPRPTGSDAEIEAGRYIADQLRSYGYVVEEQTFEFYQAARHTGEAGPRRLTWPPRSTCVSRTETS